MDKISKEKLEKSLEEQDYRSIYLSLLKFFREFDKNDLSRKKSRDIVNLINRNKTKIVLSEKEKYLEQSVSEILKNAEIYTETKIKNEERELFFKNQIQGLLFREFDKIQSLLEDNEIEEQITEILIFLFNYIQFNPTKKFFELYELYEGNRIKKDNFRALIKSIFDFSPNEIIIAVLSLLKKNNAQKGIKIPIIDLMEVLLIQSDIYPELFENVIEYLIERMEQFPSDKTIVLAVQIIQRLIENRPQLFISRFFDLLKIFKNLIMEGPDSAILLMESALNALFLGENFSILEYFNKNLGEDYRQILVLMHKKTKKLNEIICDFIIDYVNYSKYFHHEGKITKGILESYIFILEFLLNNGFSNEYLLFSMLNQLKMKKFEIEQISEKLKHQDIKRTRKELDKYYNKVIEELKKYIEIIFK